jgi:hypothetical protein
VADEEIQVPIAVAVEETGAGGPLIRIAGHARPRGHVDETARRIAIEVVVPDAGHEHVDATVAVVVPHRDPHPVGAALQPRAPGHVLETTATVVAV